VFRQPPRLRLQCAGFNEERRTEPRQERSSKTSQRKGASREAEGRAPEYKYSLVPPAVRFHIFSMPWFVRYKDSAADLIVRMRTPEQAIETACRLLDAGFDVYAIGTGPLTDSIERDQIDLIFEMWVRARLPRSVARDGCN
jgi:hypothetical protein